MRFAVVGHVEWVEFGRVDHVPAAGEIIHATETWEEAGGGGAVAAVQLAKLAGSSDFFTAVGDDELGSRTVKALESHGLTVHAAVRAGPTRRAVTFVDPSGERTITTLGERLQPQASDPLPWDHVFASDGVYFTAGEPRTLRLARRARILVITSRAFDVLVSAPDVVPDAVVGSGRDPSERYEASALRERPGLAVLTEGSRGGAFMTADDGGGRYASTPVPGAVVDTYGSGDSFAAGITFALAEGLSVDETLAFAARCGAACVGGRGPFGGQLTRDDL